MYLKMYFQRYPEIETTRFGNAFDAFRKPDRHRPVILRSQDSLSPVRRYIYLQFWNTQASRVAVLFGSDAVLRGTTHEFSSNPRKWPTQTRYDSEFT